MCNGDAMRLLALSATLCILVRMNVTAGADQGKVRFPLHEPIKEAELSPRPTAKPKPFRGYGRFQYLFRDFCRLLRLDGRADKLFEITDSAAVRDSACLACQPLMKSFAVACKPAASRKRAKETPSAVPAQREPRPDVLVSATKLASSLAEEQGTLAETRRAMDRLVALLRSSEGKTVGERDYFAEVSHCLEKPFKVSKNGSSQEEGSSSAQTEPEIKLEELF